MLCVYKKTRLKVYLINPRRTMKVTLIFFKIVPIVLDIYNVANFSFLSSW